MERRRSRRISPDHRRRFAKLFNLFGHEIPVKGKQFFFEVYHLGHSFEEVAKRHGVDTDLVRAKIWKIRSALVVREETAATRARSEKTWKIIKPRFLEAFKRLQDEERTVIYLRYLRGMSKAETMQRMGFNVNTYTRVLNRASGQLSALHPRVLWSHHCTGLPRPEEFERDKILANEVRKLIPTKWR